MDLNGDVGEYFASNRHGDDGELIPLLTSANVACGFHAGDPLSMSETVGRCLDAGVSIGAHPSYPDQAGFGRRYLAMTSAELRATVIYQVSALAGMARAAGATARHVKAHGALYNRMFADNSEARAFVEAIAQLDDDLVILGQPASALEAEADRLGIRFAREGFADRRYRQDGTLVPRDQAGAVIHDLDQQVAQAIALAKGQVFQGAEGMLRLRVDSICLHGDTPGAAGAARAIRDALVAGGIEIEPLC
ncbi:MAG: 5-oxoprolinase subunit PxpA [Actinomycetota bacterium]|nr:5-oxoprolinase subunit PxpA [Actinomycetota bacterium]